MYFKNVYITNLRRIRFIVWQVKFKVALFQFVANTKIIILTICCSFGKPIISLISSPRYEQVTLQIIESQQRSKFTTFENSDH